MTTTQATWSYGSTFATAGLLASTAARDASTTRSTTYAYDVRGRVISQTLPAPGVGSGTYTVGFGYDGADHQTTMNLPAVGAAASETVTPATTPSATPTR